MAIATPTNLSVSQSALDKYHQLNLSWTNNSSAEDGHKIERRRPDGSFVQIDTVAVAATTYIDSSPELEANTTYQYRVRAYEGEANSAYSNIDSNNTVTYFETVTIPPYDSENPEHFIIDSVADFAQINNATYRIFYIEPGNYLAAGHLVFTRGGTEQNPRMFVLRDPASPTDTTNPFFLAEADRARIQQFNIDEASYIIFNRLTFEGTGRCNIIGTFNVTQENFTPSSYNIIDNCFVKEPASDFIIIDDGCDYNTFQNNIMHGGQNNGSDMVCIALFAHRNGGRIDTFAINGTKIIGNEIYNMGDGVQFVDHLSFMTEHPDYRNNIIAYNDIYINSGIYSDGAGNFTTEGAWASSENSIDIKAGSHSSLPEHWNRIVSNRMWGYRRTDPNLGGSSPGEVVVLHNLYIDEHGAAPSGWIVVRNNVFIDLVNGLYVVDQQHNSILNNITYDVDKKTANYDAWCMGVFIGADNVEYYGNYLIDVVDTIDTNPSGVNYADWIYGYGYSDGIDIRNNIIIECEDQSYGGGTNTIADYNAFYNSDALNLPGTNNIEYANNSDSNNATLYILRKKLTAPEIFEIPYGRTTPSSPHYNALDSDPSSTADRGVSNHNLIYTEEQDLPALPTNLVATRISGTRVDLAWDLNSTNEDCIAICRKTGEGGDYAVIEIVARGDTTYIDLSVDSSVYYYKIMAVGSLGAAGYSNEAQDQSGEGAKLVAILAG